MRISQCVAMLAIATITITACKKNDDNSVSVLVNKGAFTINDTTYYTASTASFTVNANLLSVDISSPETIDTVNLVSFYLKSSDTTSLPAGTFTFKDQNDAGFDSTKNFYGGYLMAGLLYNTLDYVLEGDITDGTCTISKDADRYSVTYKITVAGTVVKGSYSGSISKTQ